MAERRWAVIADSAQEAAWSLQSVFTTCEPRGWCWLGGKWKCKSLSCVWLFVTPWNVAHQAPLSMEFPLNTGVVANPFFRESFQHRDWTLIFCIAGRFFIVWTPRVGMETYNKTANKSLRMLWWQSSDLGLFWLKVIFTVLHRGKLLF